MKDSLITIIFSWSYTHWRLFLVWFYAISTIVGYLMPNQFLSKQTVLFQTIQFDISTVSIYTKLNIKTVLFQTIQFCRGTPFSSIWNIDRSPSSATTPSPSEPESDVNEGLLCIPKSSSITGASLSDYFVPYPGHTFGEVSPLSRDTVVVFYSLSRLGFTFFFQTSGHIFTATIFHYRIEVETALENFLAFIAQTCNAMLIESENA